MIPGHLHDFSIINSFFSPGSVLLKISEKNTRQYSGQIRTPRGVGMKQLSWKVGKKTASGPPKFCPANLKINIFSCFLPKTEGNSAQFQPFHTFREDKTPNFRRFAPFQPNIRHCCTLRARKIREENRLFSTGGGERNRICGQNIDGWTLKKGRPSTQN